MIEKKDVLEHRVMKLLTDLEYKKGDIVSYEDLVTRLGIWCQLKKAPHVESCVAHFMNLIEDSEAVEHYFRVLGETEDVLILKKWARGATTKDLMIPHIVLFKIVRRYLRRLFAV